MKIVINREFGGFGLSNDALKELRDRKGNPNLSDWEIHRDDPVLIGIVERMGKKANGNYSDLKIVEVPDEVQWEIQEYDGMEWVAEIHRTWR
jgi:hypothetical protein